MKAAILERLLAERRARRAVALVTRLSDGAQSLVWDRHWDGDVALTASQLAEVRRLLAAGRSALIEEEPERLFARAYGVPPRLFIVGAVHITQALAPMAALAGFEVTVVDPRRAWATAERLPGVGLSHDWPDKALAGAGLDASCAVVTLSHDPKLDDPALVAALASDAFYIGALGSTRTHAKRMERLAQQGLGEAAKRIHAPVGLALGGRAPAEIAIAILAQIIQTRYR
jgi:xanthine dehydrogenase accessory factor